MTPSKELSPYRAYLKQKEEQIKREEKMADTDIAMVKVADRQAYIAQMKEEINGLDWADMKSQYADNATDKEFAIFLDTCKANVLDPRKKECYFVKYGQAKGQIITGYQTYIKRAERTGLLNGWSVSTVVGGDGKVAQAIITIYRKDFDQPFVWEVDAKEFNKGQSTWMTMPSFMLKKVCIAQGFRLAFPDEVGGLPYTSEEVSTYADEDTSKAALEQTSNKARAIDVTSNVVIKPAPKAKAKPKAKPASKAASVEPVAPVEPVVDDTLKGAEPVTEAKVVETEKKVAVSAEDAVLLADATKATILGCFDGHSIGRELIEGVLDTVYDEWNEGHRVWLVEKYHECDEGQLDATKFSALTY